MNKKLAFIIASASMGLMLGENRVSAENDHKIWICHVVNGAGELGNGYNLIEVDQSAADGDGHNDHTQHVSNDGRTDMIPAPGGSGSTCGGTTTTTTSTSSTTTEVTTSTSTTTEPPTVNTNQATTTSTESSTLPTTSSSVATSSSSSLPGPSSSTPSSSVTPSTAPASTVQPGPSTSAPSGSSTPVPSVTSSPSSPSPGVTLPATGGEVSWPIGFAIALIAAGGLCLLALKR